MELSPTFTGTHADVLVTLILRCVQNGGNHLVPLFTTLLTTFLNLTPYIKVSALPPGVFMRDVKEIFHSRVKFPLGLPVLKNCGEGGGGFGGWGAGVTLKVGRCDVLRITGGG